MKTRQTTLFLSYRRPPQSTYFEIHDLPQPKLILLRRHSQPPGQMPPSSYPQKLYSHYTQGPRVHQSGCDPDKAVRSSDTPNPPLSMRLEGRTQKHLISTRPQRLEKWVHSEPVPEITRQNQTKMETSMSGTKWRQPMQVLKEKQNYLQKQKLTSLLRDQQRTPANPQMPRLFSLSLDLLVPLIQIRKKATKQPVS